MKKWVKIPYYERYEINKRGDVRNTKTRKILKHTPMPKTFYPTVCLKNERGYNRVYVHRLLALTFIDNPDPLSYNHVGFKDVDSKSIDLSNLYWTDRYGIAAGRLKRDRYARGSKHPMTSLTEEEVKQIREIYQSGRLNQTELAKKYKVDPSAIYFIVNNITWKHV